MVSQKYRGSCIGAALAKWLAKNTVASQKMALEEKMEDGALEMLLQSVQMAYIMPKTRKITKIHELPYYIEGKMGSKPKSDKRVKKVKSTGKVNNGMKGEQWHEAISQPTKFHRLRKFHNLALCFFSSFGFCFSFLLVSDL